MFTRLAIQTSSFKKEDQGSATIIFSLIAFIMLMFGGLAIDYGRITDVQESLTNAADSASLAAGKALLEGKLEEAEIIEMAEKYFVSNTKYTKKIGKTSKPQISVDRSSGKVSVKAESVVSMTLGVFGGYKEMTVPVVSEAVYKQKDVEVGLALDITGSMGDPDFSRQPKIDGLKQAFQKFADKLMPDDSKAQHSVKIGVAPYSSAVNLGTHVTKATGNSKDSCVTEREKAAPSDDVTNYFVKADGVKDVDPTEGYGDPRNGGYAYGCPSAQIEPLSKDKQKLVAKVNAFKPEGWTSGHLGTQWAWNLISDKWNLDGEKAESYQLVKAGKLIKAVVLMTDGIFNTSYHGGTSSSQAIGLCKEMQSKGVVVFTVGFEGPKGAADAATLKACATPNKPDEPSNFAMASNAAELEAIFERFAGQLTKLRISK